MLCRPLVIYIRVAHCGCVKSYYVNIQFLSPIMSVLHNDVQIIIIIITIIIIIIIINGLLYMDH